MEVKLIQSIMINLKHISDTERTGVVNKKLQYKVGNTDYKEMSSDTQDIYFWVNPKVVTITFNLNNGTGTVPQAITAQAGQTIDLPSSDGIHRNNYIMLGGQNKRFQYGSKINLGNAIQIYSLNGNSSSRQRCNSLCSVGC